jgi:methylase of polypeptide subunit release factors
MSTEPFEWHSESDTPAPKAISVVTDSLTADEALTRVRKGEFLLYQGDFLNARQLLSAMGRRIKTPGDPKTPLDAFRLERKTRAFEHEWLGRVLVELNEKYTLKLSRAPDVKEACEQVWGACDAKRTLVSLKTLIGMMGAAQWRKTGLSIPGFKQKLIPHYGVYIPTRTDYIDLVHKIRDVKDLHCFDIGTGSGVIGLLLLHKGAKSVIGTDLEPRAIACAKENAKHFGVSDKFTIDERPLFPNSSADLIVCNPPWIPEIPKNRVDVAVFDENSKMLLEFLAKVGGHLNPGGRAALIISNLPELLGLWPVGFLASQFEKNNLACTAQYDVAAKHSKAKDVNDRLHQVRSKEVISLFVLQPKING